MTNNLFFEILLINPWFWLELFPCCLLWFWDGSWVTHNCQLPLNHIVKASIQARKPKNKASLRSLRTRKLQLKHTFNTLYLTSSKTRKGTLVLWSGEARTNGTLQIMNGSRRRRTTFSWSSRSSSSHDCNCSNQWNLKMKKKQNIKMKQSLEGDKVADVVSFVEETRLLSQAWMLMDRPVMRTPRHGFELKI